MLFEHPTIEQIRERLLSMKKKKDRFLFLKTRIITNDYHPFFDLLTKRDRKTLNRGKHA